MKVRVALIGCGIISDPHIAGYRQIEDRAEVVAVVDTAAERARAAAEKLGDPRQLTDYREALSAPDVDAVDLCLPHHLHCPVAVAALEAGKHVLVEKPISPTLAEADAMIAASQQAGRALCVGENFRFFTEVARARELLAEGVIGEPILIQTTLGAYLGGPYLDTAWRFKAAEAGGGALLDSGIHHVDLFLALMGPAVSVSCYTKRVRDLFPAEDIALVMAQFANGALGEMLVGWTLRHVPGLLFRIAGTEGSLTARSGAVEVASERLSGGPAVYETRATSGFPEEIADFVECAATGKRPTMGGPEARADLEFVLAAYESARTGSRVAVGSRH